MLDFLFKKACPPDVPYKKPIKDIAFCTPHGTKLVYTPQPDITPYELAQLFPLFATGAAAMASLLHACDWEDYIIEHNLKRHFTEHFDYDAS